MNISIVLLVMLGFPLFGLLLCAMASLIYGARGPVGNTQVWIYFTSRLIGTIIFVGSFLLIFLPGTIFLSGIALLFGGYALNEWIQGRRDLQKQAVWSLLVNSQQQKRSLTDTLAMHSARFSGSVGRAYSKLHAALLDGVSLPEALGNNPRCIPRDAMATVALCGSEPLPANSHLIGAHSQRVTNLWGRIYFFLSYMLCTTFYGIFVLTFMMLFIVPAFVKIFEDFGLALPNLTLGLVKAAHFGNESTIFTLIALAILLVLLLIFLTFLFNLFDKSILQGFFDRLGWFKHQSQILNLISEGISRKLPFVETMNRLTYGTAYYQSKLGRKRLKKAARLESVGHSWIDSLYRAKIIRKRDVGPLITGLKAGNINWALRRVSEDMLEQAILRWSLIEKIVLPLIVILFGTIVAWIVIGLFVPLVSLIEKLT